MQTETTEAGRARSREHIAAQARRAGFPHVAVALRLSGEEAQHLATLLEALRADPAALQEQEIAALKERMRRVAAALCLPRHEAQALEALIDIWQPAGGLWPEQETIAERAFYGARRVRSALVALRHVRKLITWERRRYRGVQTSNLYQFTPQFWALVRGEAGTLASAGGGCATDGKQSRPQAVKGSVRRRQPLPTKGDLPLSDQISLNGGGGQSSAIANPAPLTTPAPTPIPPSPSGSSHQEGETQSPARPLIRIFAEERSRVAAYAGTDHGSMRPEHLHAAEAQIAAFAAEACTWAAERGIACELETVREALTRDILRRWLAHPGTAGPEAPRGFLIERAHPLGLLRGDLPRFGPLAVAAWKAAHTPKRAPLAPLAEPPARRRGRGDQPGVTFQPPAHVRTAEPAASTRPAGPSPAPAAPLAPPLAEADESDEARERRKEQERAAETRAWAQIQARAAIDVGRTVPAASARPERAQPLGLSPERLEAWRALLQEEQRAAELAAEREQHEARALDTAAADVAERERDDAGDVARPADKPSVTSERHERAAKLRAFLGSAKRADDGPLEVTIDRLRAFQRSAQHEPIENKRAARRVEPLEEHQEQHDEADSAAELAGVDEDREPREAETAIAAEPMPEALTVKRRGGRVRAGSSPRERAAFVAALAAVARMTSTPADVLRPSSPASTTTASSTETAIAAEPMAEALPRVLTLSGG